MPPGAGRAFARWRQDRGLYFRAAGDWAGAAADALCLFLAIAGIAVAVRIDSPILAFLAFLVLLALCRSWRRERR